MSSVEGMDALDADRIRASFVNCSKGEAAAIVIPGLTTVDWEKLDFLAWRNPRMPQRAYLVAPMEDGPVGVVLRVAANRNHAGAMRTSMCEFCHTVHSAGGVTLFTAAKAGGSGRHGNSVGAYFCADLECSRYARGTKRPIRVQPQTTMTVDERVDRLNSRLRGVVSSIAPQRTA